MVVDFAIVLWCLLINYVQVQWAPTGDPLLLTSFIDQNCFDEARNLSKVRSSFLDIESFSGFLTVDRQKNSHMFFWFIPKNTPAKENNASRAPLILWLQGTQVGCSSLIGLFTENGPFEVINGELSEVKRKYAWTDEYNVLYVDQFIGSGFSYTEDKDNGYISTEKEVSDHLYEALVQFYQLFPEYKRNDLFIAGESHSGKHVPAIANKIFTENTRSYLPVFKIPLKGMIIGSGYSHPENMIDIAGQLINVGLIDPYDYEDTNLINEARKKVVESIRGKEWENAYWEMKNFFQQLYNILGFEIYDYTKDHLKLNQFLTNNDRRQAIHVGEREFKYCSTIVEERFKGNLMKTVQPWIEDLLAIENYPILFYSGEFSLLSSYSMNEKFLRTLNWTNRTRYAQASRKEWHLNSTGKVAGYYRSHSNLAHALVRNAGHFVQADQPEAVLELIRLFTGGKL